MKTMMKILYCIAQYRSIKQWPLFPPLLIFAGSLLILDSAYAQANGNGSLVLCSPTYESGKSYGFYEEGKPTCNWSPVVDPIVSFRLSNSSHWKGNGTDTAGSTVRVAGYQDGRLFLKGIKIELDGPTFFNSDANFGDKKITKLAAGIADTDAVNVSQLNALKQELSSPSSPLAVLYDNNKQTVYLGGKSQDNPAPVLVTNVKNGNVAAGSLDAINGGQLYQKINEMTAKFDQVPENLTSRLKLAEMRIDDIAAEVNEEPKEGDDEPDFYNQLYAPDYNGLYEDEVEEGPPGKKALLSKRAGKAQKEAADDEVEQSTATEKEANLNKLARRDLGGSVSQMQALANVRNTERVSHAQLQNSMDAAIQKANQYTDEKFATLKRDADSGTAAAMAVAGLPQATAAGESMLSAAGGLYQGQSAIAVGISTVTPDNRWVVKVSSTINKQRKFGGVLGVGYRW
jgi:trimeric autotransporter adhesin